MVIEQNNVLTIDTIVEKSMNYLNKQDPEEVIVFGNDQVNYQIRFSKSNILVSKRWAAYNVGFLYVKDKKLALTQISDISSMDRIYKALDELIIFAKAIPPKEDWGGIAEGPFTYKQIPETYDSAIHNFSDKAVDHIEQGLNAATEAGARHSAGVLQWGYSTFYLQTNHNVEVKEEASSFEYLIRSFLEPIESGQGICVGRMLKTLDCNQAGNLAGTIAKDSISSKPGKAGTYNALLSPTVVADIVAQTVTDANPYSIDIGQSWLKDKIGDKVSVNSFTAYDDAAYPNGFNSRKADLEGVPSQQTKIIENGVLKNLIHNTTTAKKAGTKTTSNAGPIFPTNSNIIIEPGTYSFDELIQECKKPTIYVTSNWYTRQTNAIEGIFSTIPRDGMFLIENGEITQPVRELRISDSYPNLMQNIVAIHKKNRQIKWWLEVTTPTFAPAMLIENVTFTTGTR
jgi:PmbA protein